LEISAQKQIGPQCVSTSLAILCGVEPEIFQGKVNTQDPLSWSDHLKPYGMKLAYCPTDARKIQFYIPELVELDDLFTLSYYTTSDQSAILADPDASGWITESHIVILHRDRIYDPASGIEGPAEEHHCNSYHTKRIFRVVPKEFPRGL
jgi:hypothetical protein